VQGSWIGLVVLFGASWALIHHMLGGLRHFVWDFGYAMGRHARNRIALANLVGSVVLTVLLWAVGIWLR
jgi:succinate dehydrogenase / fumarate reductase cytochrome b subunit